METSKLIINKLLMESNSNHRFQQVKVGVIIFAFCLSFFSTNTVLGVIVVPGGKVYSITLTNPTYEFDHASYSIFIPDSVTSIRGIFIHQHGCGMQGTGYPTAYDIQYQEFAKKWHLAIVGPDIYPKTGGSCFQWINPNSGSGPALLTALDSIAQQSDHKELITAPWLLWGHSGGGYWVLAMTKTYPERIIATFAYSPALNPDFAYPELATKIPIMIRCAGAGDANAIGVNCWGTASHTFSKLRSVNGYISIAYTKDQNHNFSYVRYIAIPFFESVLTQRLPTNGDSKLCDMDSTKAWLGDTLSNKVFKLSTYSGNKLSKCWLPDSVLAKKWSEYVTTGIVKDTTPPSVPYSVEIVDEDTTYQRIIWKSNVDYESGIKYFKILKNNSYFQSKNYQTFDTNGDNCLPPTLPKMDYNIKRITGDKTYTFSIISVNNFDLESEPCSVIQKSSAINGHIINH